jgi:hypothetical protein
MEGRWLFALVILVMVHSVKPQSGNGYENHKKLKTPQLKTMCHRCETLHFLVSKCARLRATDCCISVISTFNCRYWYKEDGLGNEFFLRTLACSKCSRSRPYGVVRAGSKTLAKEKWRHKEHPAKLAVPGPHVVENPGYELGPSPTPRALRSERVL